MSWESTVSYYCLINEAVRARLGGLHSAKIALYSVDFHEIEKFQRSGDWEAAGAAMATAAQAPKSAGANCLVLCTNTLHKVASAIETSLGIPLLHIADPTGAEISQAGLLTVELLGTRFTMEQDFYKARLREHHGLHMLIPEPSDREVVHRIIYDSVNRQR